jgi:hypothetical protein
MENGRKFLEEKVKELAVELPGITFGYIGNCERWGDDRSWEIFLPHPGRIGTYADCVSLGPTISLDKRAVEWETLRATAIRKYYNNTARLENFKGAQYARFKTLCALCHAGTRDMTAEESAEYATLDKQYHLTDAYLKGY